MSERVFEGKTVFVTGGSGGIGSACAESLVQDGAAALLMGRRREALEKTRQDILARNPDATVEVFAGDALQEADVRAALAEAHALRGRLDVVIPTVGGGAIRPLLMHDAETFRTDLELNIMSAFIAVRYAAPLMVPNGGGTIVLISSDAAKLPFPWLSAYSTAKNGLEGFVRSAAEELARHEIRVNAVRPGMTRTESTRALFAAPEIHRRFAEEKPLGRLGEPEDIAPGVRYLAGPGVVLGDRPEFRDRRRKRTAKGPRPRPDGGRDLRPGSISTRYWPEKRPSTEPLDRGCFGGTPASGFLRCTTIAPRVPATSLARGGRLARQAHASIGPPACSLALSAVLPVSASKTGRCPAQPSPSTSVLIPGCGIPARPNRLVRLHAAQLVRGPACDRMRGAPGSLERAPTGRNRLREYETTFIVQPEISEEGNVPALLEKLDGILSKTGGARRA